MKIILTLAFVLLLLCAASAFSQQLPLIQTVDHGAVSVPVRTRDDRAETPPNFSDDNARYGIQRFKARGGNTVDWGLALSGGGIRWRDLALGC